ncbi:MAG TPA: ABC transporter ATP-binding protein [Lacunisphaera sp.]|nr:ABC transporter ATP-binding protein [Lacunisphaera sp.]
MRELSEVSWAIELENFGKCHRVGWTGRRAVAVHPLSLKVARGEVWGLLGPNGSGKSTTLKALAGLIRPTSGHCRIMGHPAGSAVARALVGYLAESPQFPPHQTGRDYLHYCAGLSGVPSRERAQRVAEILTRTGLAAAADGALATYSKGMRQRLGLAQAMVHEPAVLLLDEPASGLDPEGRLDLARLIRELAGRGSAVVFSSHLVTQAAAICDRIAVLSCGRLLAAGTPAELLGENARSAELSPLEKFYWERVHG